MHVLLKQRVHMQSPQYPHSGREKIDFFFLSIEIAVFVCFAKTHEGKIHGFIWLEGSRSALRTLHLNRMYAHSWCVQCYC